ncbi:hypothetical protein [Helicobacter pylori]|uniref:hypothetical protein n=1 Tax=Helicobacter pylori TaxID=210 RepID=UPI000EB1B828|nr:hypothetical protein [Helicobacter pylori]
MWNEEIIKVMTPILLLFCLLGIFELVLIVNDLNKSERLEANIKNNLKVLEHITILLDERLKCMGLEHHKDKKK